MARAAASLASPGPCRAGSGLDHQGRDRRGDGGPMGRRQMATRRTGEHGHYRDPPPPSEPSGPPPDLAARRSGLERRPMDLRLPEPPRSPWSPARGRAHYTRTPPRARSGARRSTGASTPAALGPRRDRPPTARHPRDRHVPAAPRATLGRRKLRRGRGGCASAPIRRTAHPGRTRTTSTDTPTWTSSSAA